MSQDKSELRPGEGLETADGQEFTELEDAFFTTPVALDEFEMHKGSFSRTTPSSELRLRRLSGEQDKGPQRNPTSRPGATGSSVPTAGSADTPVAPATSAEADVPVTTAPSPSPHALPASSASSPESSSRPPESESGPSLESERFVRSVPVTLSEKTLEPERANLGSLSIANPAALPTGVASPVVTPLATPQTSADFRPADDAMTAQNDDARLSASPPVTGSDRSPIPFRPPIQTQDGVWRGDVVQVPDVASSILTGTSVDSDEYDAALFDLSEASEEGEVVDTVQDGPVQDELEQTGGAGALLEGAGLTSEPASAKAISSQLGAEGADAAASDEGSLMEPSHGGPSAAVRVIKGLGALAGVGVDGPDASSGDVGPTRLPDTWLRTDPSSLEDTETAEVPLSGPATPPARALTSDGVEVAIEDVEEMELEIIDPPDSGAISHEALAAAGEALQAADAEQSLPLKLSLDVPAGLAEALQNVAAERASHDPAEGASEPSTVLPAFLPSSGELVQFSEEGHESAAASSASASSVGGSSDSSADVGEPLLDEITLDDATLEDAPLEAAVLDDDALDEDDLESAAEVTSPALALSDDPGDLPEPAPRDDSFRLPVAELPPELGWDIRSASHSSQAFGATSSAAGEPMGESFPLEAAQEPVPTFSGSFLASGMMAAAAAVGLASQKRSATDASRFDNRSPEPHLSSGRSEITRLEGTVQIWDIPALTPVDIPQEVELEEVGGVSTPVDGASRFASPLLQERLVDSSPFLSLDEQSSQAVALLRADASHPELQSEPSVRAALLLEVGRLHLEKGNHTEAMEAFEESLSHHDSFEPTLRALASLAEQQGLWDKVIDTLETQALASSDPLVHAGLQARIALVRRSRFSKDDARDAATQAQALKDLLEAIRSAPDSTYLLSLYEKQARRLEDWKALASALENQARFASSESAMLLRVQAATLAWEKSNDLATAVRLLETVFQMRTDYSPARTLLERIRRALLDVRGEKSANPRPSDGPREWDGTLLARLEGLEQTIEAGLTAEEAPLSSLLRAVDRSAAQGQATVAMQQLQQALDRAPLNPWLRREFQGWLARTGDWVTYRRTLQQELLQTDEAVIQALIHFFDAMICAEALADTTSALSSLEAALKLQPDWRLARLEQLRLLRARGGLGALVAIYQTLAEREASSERCAAWHFLTGLAQERLQQPEAAQGSYEQALALDPEQRVYAWHLRQFLSARGDWAGLEQLLARGAAPWPLSMPSQAASAGELALRGTLAELTRQDLETAEQCYAQALEAGDGSVLVVEGLMRVLARQERWGSLAELLGRLAETAGEPASRGLLLWSQAHILNDKLGQPAQVPGLLQAVLEHSDFLPARWMILEGALAAGQLDGWQGAFGGAQSAASEGADGTANPASEQAQRLETLGEAIYRARRGLGAPFAGAGSVEASSDRLAIDLHECYLFEIGDTHALGQLYGARLEQLSDPSSRRYLSQRRAGWREQEGDLAGAFELLLGLAQEGVVDGYLLDWLESLAGRLNQDEILNTHLASLLDLAPSDGLRLRLARRLESLDVAETGAHPEARALYETVVRGSTRTDGGLDANVVLALEGLVRLGLRADARVELEGSAGESNGLVAAAHHTLGEALARLASRSGSEQQRAELHFMAAEALTAAGDRSAAEASWELALASPVVEAPAFCALVQRFRERGEVGGLERLYARKIAAEERRIERQCLVMELADELEALGGINFAIQHFQPLAEQERHLAACLRLERIHLGQEAWEPFVSALEARAEALHPVEARSQTHALIQRVRAERLRDPWALEQNLTRQLKESPLERAPFETLRALLASQERWTDLASLLEERAVVESPGEARGRVLLDLAWLYAHPLDDLDVAHDRYQDVLDNIPGEAEALSCLREICEQREDWNGVVATLARQSLVESPEQQVETYRSIARLWDHKLNEPVTAAQAWHRVLDVSPGDKVALTALYDLFRRLENWSSLLEVGEQLLAVRKDEDPGLLTDLGNVAVRNLGDLSRGIAWLLRGGVRGRADTDTLMLASEQLEEGGEYAQCVELYHRIVGLTDSPALQVECFQRIAFLNRERLGDVPAAITAWREVLRLVPDHLEVMWAVSQLQLDLGEGAGALATAQGLLTHPACGVFLDSLAPEDRVAFHRTIGQLEDSFGSKEAAVAQYEVAIQLAPDDQELQGALAGLYQSLEQWGRYAALLRDLMQRQPDVTPDVQQGRLEALARAYHAADDEQGVLDACSQLRKLVPGYMPAYRLMAEVYAKQESWSQLLDLYNAMIKHASDLADVVDAYLCKADILDIQLVPTNPTYLPKAVRHYMKAVEYDRRNVYAMLRLAEISLKTLQYTQADDWLRRALALEPPPYQLAQTWLLGGVLCAEVQHNQPRALAIFQKAAELAPQVADKLELLEAAIARSPGNLEGLLKLFHEILPYQR